MKQLERDVRATLQQDKEAQPQPKQLGQADVQDAVDRVLALDAVAGERRPAAGLELEEAGGG